MSAEILQGTSPAKIYTASVSKDDTSVPPLRKESIHGFEILLIPLISYS